MPQTTFKNLKVGDCFSIPKATGMFIKIAPDQAATGGRIYQVGTVKNLDHEVNYHYNDKVWMRKITEELGVRGN
jgi:hypothetical protein